MKFEYYDKYIGKRTTWKYDTTPIYANPKVLCNLVDDLIRPFKNFNKVVSLEALGFIIGGAIAHKLKVW